MKLFSAVRRGYGSLRIQAKFLIMIILAASIPMIVLAVILSRSLYRMVISDTIRNEQVSAARSAPLISDSLSEITDYYSLIRSYTFSRRLFDNTIEEPLADMLTSSDALSYEKRVSDDAAGAGVTALRIYIDLPSGDGTFSGLPDDSVFCSMDTVRTTYWRGIFASSHPSNLFCPPFYLGQRERKNLGDCAYIRPAHIRDSSGTATLCYIAVYFSSDTLKNILRENQTQEQSVSYITNQRDAMVTSTDASLAGLYYMDYDSIRTNLMSSNGFLETQVLGETVYVSYYYLPDAEWFLVTVTPSLPLRERAARIIWTVILVLIGAMLVAILIGARMARSLSKRITAVSTQMSRVKNGLPIPMASPVEQDEIGELTDSYNFMARQINNLVAEQQRSSEELRMAEFNSLQAQINPHFLYNTMEMINWMAQQGRIKETGAAIRDLSSFYRLTLSKKGTISTVGEELEHITIYMRLQNMRFDNAIDFVVDVPDSLMDYHMPRLTLQPIIENAVLHGILEKPSGRGTIVVTGWQDADDVIILISDDGVGMSSDMLDLILTGKMPSTGKGSHIAISNTHRRLQILYGEKYGLHYSSTPGKGTDVEVRFPAYIGGIETNPYIRKGLGIPRVTGNSSVPEPSGKNPFGESPAGLVRYNNDLARSLFQIRKLHNIFRVLPENQNIYIVSHLVTEPFPVHRHDYFEMNYLCSGVLVNAVDGHDLRMSPGSMLIMNEHASHGMSSPEGDALVVNICFNHTYLNEVLGAAADSPTVLGSFLRGINSPRNYLFYPFSRITGVQPLLSDIIELYSRDDYHDSQELDVLFYRMFEVLSESEPQNEGINPIYG